MTGIVVFVACLVLASGYACWRGGAPERTVGLLLIAAAVATSLTPLQMAYTYRGLNIPVLRIDLVLLACLVVVALIADRFWPMWVAAVQLTVIAAHGVRVYSPDIVPIAYWALASRFAYLMLMLLAAGTYRHRQRLRAGMTEFGWTRQRLRDDGRSCASSIDGPLRR